MKRIAAIVAVASAFACGSSSTSPSSTLSPQPTVTSVALAATVPTFANSGTTAQVMATATISNGTTQIITSVCTGWASDNTFVLTVSGSGLITALHSGAATVTAMCQGVFARNTFTLSLRPDTAFTQSGVGNFVFDLPTYVSRVHIVGTFTGFCCSNFIVKIAGNLVVNDVIGPSENSTVSDGVYLTTGGTVQITDSSGVSWTLTEVR